MAFGSEGFRYEAQMEHKYPKASTYITSEEHDPMDGGGKMITNLYNLDTDCSIDYPHQKALDKGLMQYPFYGTQLTVTHLSWSSCFCLSVRF